MATTLGIGGQALLGCLAAAAVSLTLVVPALAEEAIGVALIDPFSGPFANVGTTAFRAFQMEFDRINSAGGTLGRSFKVVPFDSKSSAQEATLQVQAAIDQGLRYVFQGSGSNVAHAVSEAIAKYNARNPAAPVLYLNYGALDPALTDEKCHFWHFRLVAHGHMILNAVTGAAARRPQMRRVYLINQDYAWGQSVSKDARAMLAEKRPDVEIVGDDLHPLGKIKDFAPYVAKIKAAGADTVITGNWGNDLSLLVKAMRDSGGTIDMFAPIAGLQGTAAAWGNRVLGGSARYCSGIRISSPTRCCLRPSRFAVDTTRIGTGYQSIWRRNFSCGQSTRPGRLNRRKSRSRLKVWDSPDPPARSGSDQRTIS